MVAAEARRIDILKYLIEEKADLEHRNKLGNTALLISAKDGIVPAIKVSEDLA